MAIEKTILVFGDSLTFGSNPQKSGTRHAYEDRWPTILERELGDKVRVIANALGGRTSIFDDYGADAIRNSSVILPTVLMSEMPLDLIIFMLGTNDIKPHLGRTALEASHGMARLVQITRAHCAARNVPVPKILMVAPPPIVQTNHAEMLHRLGGEFGMEQSRQFPEFYRRRATELGLPFFDASAIASADPGDGAHLSVEECRKLGVGIAPTVRQILGL